MAIDVTTQTRQGGGSTLVDVIVTATDVTGKTLTWLRTHDNNAYCMKSRVVGAVDGDALGNGISELGFVLIDEYTFSRYTLYTFSKHFI